MSKFLSLLASSLCALVVGCASSSSGSGGASAEEGERMRVTLRDYKGGNVFELVSESHTSRVDYYSEARSDASRKIQTDEVMEVLIKELEKQGLKKHRQEGRAPSQGGAVISWGIEVEEGPQTDHWVVGKGSAVDEIQAFNECRNAFLQLYNITASYQAIENPEGKQIFQKPPQGRT